MSDSKGTEENMEMALSTDNSTVTIGGLENTLQQIDKNQEGLNVLLGNLSSYATRQDEIIKRLKSEKEEIALKIKSQYKPDRTRTSSGSPCEPGKHCKHLQEYEQLKKRIKENSKIANGVIKQLKAEVEKQTKRNAEMEKTFEIEQNNFTTNKNEMEKIFETEKKNFDAYKKETEKSFETEKENFDAYTNEMEKRFETEKKNFSTYKNEMENKFEFEKRKLNGTIVNLQEKVEHRAAEVFRVKEHLERAKHENYRLENDNKSLNNRLRQLQEELRISKRQSLKVALFSSVQQKLVQSISTELESMVKCHMETMEVDVLFQNISDPKDRLASFPFIVMCINASRLGTDTHQALQFIHCDNTVALLVLHHKEIHALPAQTSDKMLTGERYRSLGAIIDIAYTTSKGMYPCNLNEIALTKLESFLLQFKHM